MTIILSFYALNREAAVIAPKEVLQTLLGKSEEISNITIWNIRLPRIIGGLIVGAGLGVAGNIMLTCIGNPLASPSTLGISSAAAFEANIAIVFFNAGLVRNSSEAILINNPYIVTIFAFGFSILAMFSILAIARLKGSSKESIILAGATVSSHAVIGAVTKALEKAGGDIQALKQKVDKDEDTPTVTEKETDVIVIGAGGAGLAAAVSSHENGGLYGSL